MMPRPVLLLFLLVILMITSQFEWKQQITNELESSSDISQKQQKSPHMEEIVKEKIILSQEKTIQRLNEFIQSLQQQLLLCRGNENTTTGSAAATSFTSSPLDEIQRQLMLED
ncbi:Peptidyl-prolyl cis-trans isomerase G [Rhynchospora pubera]|uniref:Peptidyl-prolyl cis-trans isomerase G n=1 Tax=Rhynchospora pubera TaxID=906938 RepID=A0AAV8CRB6_9POAL|nr:Peptidyl-prolyl cis-trans isomerase G [Rhynchospora pubera]